MAYNTQVYCIFGGTIPSSGILETRKYDVSETGSVSILRWEGEKTPTQLGPLERANLNQTSCFLVSRIPDDGKVQKTTSKPVIVSCLH
jgi:hypothetical protein